MAQRADAAYENVDLRVSQIAARALRKRRHECARDAQCRHAPQGVVADDGEINRIGQRERAIALPVQPWQPAQFCL